MLFFSPVQPFVKGHLGSGWWSSVPDAVGRVVQEGQDLVENDKDVNGNGNDFESTETKLEEFVGFGVGQLRWSVFGRTRIRCRRAGECILIRHSTRRQWNTFPVLAAMVVVYSLSFSRLCVCVRESFFRGVDKKKQVSISYP